MAGTGAHTVPGPVILWDIMEEHLEEAGYLWSQWEAALDAPDYTLDDVAGIEERLFAHVDGLLVGGAPVAERMLLPALEDDDPERVFAAAYTLLSSGVVELAAAVVDTLSEADDDRLPPIRRALELGPLEGLELPLRDLAAEGRPPIRAAALDVLTFHQLEAGGPLSGFLDSDDPLFLSAGLRASGLPAARTAPEQIVRAMDHVDPGVRDAALDAGLMRGLAEAMNRCRDLAAAGNPGCGHALLLLALVGDAGDHRLVEGCLELPALRDEALFALGYTGTHESATRCLDAMDTDDEKQARLAGEAFCLITGLDLEAEGLVVPERRSLTDTDKDEEEDLEDLSSLPPESFLPSPDATGVRAWWRKGRQEIEPEVRYLVGKPVDQMWLLEAMRVLPMRQRRPLALEVSLRWQRNTILRAGAWTAWQRRQLHRGAKVLIPGNESF